MSGLIKFFLVFFMIGSIAAAAEKPNKQDMSYVLGYNMGKNLKDSDVAIDINQFNEGLKAALTSEANKFSVQEQTTILSQLDSMVRENIKNKQSKLMERNKNLATKFLEVNSKKEGIQETSSGLQYQIIKNGNGEKPQSSSRVEVHYTGTLLDGREFDSSLKNNTPIQFNLNQVIPGWTEGIQLMPVGSKYRFFIPPNLAYGENVPRNSIIEPNSLLIFDVELLGFN